MAQVEHSPNVPVRNHVGVPDYLVVLLYHLCRSGTNKNVKVQHASNDFVGERFRAQKHIHAVAVEQELINL